MLMGLMLGPNMPMLAFSSSSWLLEISWGGGGSPRPGPPGNLDLGFLDLLLCIEGGLRVCSSPLTRSRRSRLGDCRLRLGSSRGRAVRDLAEGQGPWNHEGQGDCLVVSKDGVLIASLQSYICATIYIIQIIIYVKLMGGELFHELM